MYKLPTAGLTKIGTLTLGGGLSAIFDGDTGTTGYIDTTTGYVGIRFPWRLRIENIVIKSASNGFDGSSSNTTVTLALYGKSLGVPSNSTDGVLLGSTSFMDSNVLTTKTITSSDNLSEFESAWIKITTGIYCIASELEFYVTNPPIEGSPIDFSNFGIL